MKQKAKAAVVVFRTKDGRVLMHRREHPRDGNESWMFLGGSIHEGEESVAAAKREVLEEVGYTVPTLTFFRSYPEDEFSLGVDVFIADFPGFGAFHETAEGDRRNDLQLVPLDNVMKFPMIQMAKDILIDLKSSGM